MSFEVPFQLKLFSDSYGSTIINWYKVNKYAFNMESPRRFIIGRKRVWNNFPLGFVRAGNMAPLRLHLKIKNEIIYKQRYVELGVPISPSAMFHY